MTFGPMTGGPLRKRGVPRPRSSPIRYTPPMLAWRDRAGHPAEEDQPVVQQA